MKRPLFCVAMAYALGEVICLYTNGLAMKSVTIVMLVFGAYFFVKKTKNITCMLGILLAITAGAVRAFFCVPEDIKRYAQTDGGVLFAKDDTYDLYIYKGTSGEFGFDETEQELFGVITGIWNENLVVRVEQRMRYDAQTDIHANTNKKSEPDKVLGIEAGSYNSYILVYPADEEKGMFQIGDYILVRGDISLFEFATNPGGFCERIYYQARKIPAYIYAKSIQQVSLNYVNRPLIIRLRDTFYTIKQGLYSLRNQVKDVFYTTLSEDVASLYAGILLGDKSGIDQDVKRMYRLGGLAHILAISGLHITLIGNFIFRFLRRLKLGMLPAGVGAIGLVVLYGVMSGFSLATLRAVYMLVICMMAEVCGRNYDMHTAMGIALCFMLFAEPTRILDTGVQLSYMAIAGVMLGNAVLRRLQKRTGFRRWKKKHKIRYAILQSVIMSAGLNVMMAGILASSYYQLPVYSGLLNLIAIPLMPVVIVSGFFGTIFSFISLAIGKLLFCPGVLVLKLYDELCRFSLELPGNTIHTGQVSKIQIIVYYLGVALVWVLLTERIQTIIRTKFYRRSGHFLRRRGRAVCACVCAGIIVILEFGLQLYYVCSVRTESVFFLDVGQGDGILIRSADGSCMIIDGGSTSKKGIGEYDLLPALKSQGMTEIDYWFVTHTDADHISGLRELLELGDYAQIRIHTIVVSAYMVGEAAGERKEELMGARAEKNRREYSSWEELQALAKQRGIQIRTMDVGDQILGDSFRLTCMHPDAQYIPEDKNAASLALSYESDTFSMLFTGDMDADGLAYMREKYGGKQGTPYGEKRGGKQGTPYGEKQGGKLANYYDCIKVPHHGSKYSYDEALYSMADYMIISCGKNNRFGHPHVQVLEGILAAGGIVVRTDEWGAIEFRGR